MTIAATTNFYFHAHYTVLFVRWLSDLYNTARDLFRRLFNDLVALILGIIFIPLLLIIVLVVVPVMVGMMLMILAVLVRLLTKSKPPQVSALTPMDYQRERILHDRLGKDLRLLKEAMAAITEGEVSKEAWYMRLMYEKAVRAYELLQAYYAATQAAFDAIAPATDDYQGFKTLTEAELWADRPKHYQYLA